MFTAITFPSLACNEEYRCADGITVSAQSLPNGRTLAQAVRDQWRQLESQSNCSFFQSWLWIGTWLEVVVADKPALLVEMHDGNNLIGLCVLILTRQGPGLLARRFLSLNDIPFKPYDMFVEKNGCLAATGHEMVVHHALIEFICHSQTLRFDEFLLSAIPRDNLDPLSVPAPPGFTRSLTKSQHCWRIDLGYEKPPDLDHLLAKLSTNKRHQIRRTLSLYREVYGEDAEIQQAGDLEQMESFSAGLERLHTAYWVARGRSGSFHNPLWKKFHQTLMRESLPAGCLGLLRVGGKGELGYLYNYYWRGEALNIQSGFNYRPDNRWKPGYVSHLLAAVHSTAKGCRSYDLLVGDDAYKSAIGCPGVELNWLRWSRMTWRHSALTGAQRGRRQIEHLLSPSTVTTDAKPTLSSHVLRAQQPTTMATGDVRPPAVVLASGLNGLGAVRSLALRGVAVIVVATSNASLAMRSRYPRERYLVGDAPGVEAPLAEEIHGAALSHRDAILLETLSPLASRRPVLIATGDEYAEFLQDHQTRLRAMGFRFVIPPETIISLFNDKRSEMEFIAQADIPHPRTLVRLPSSATEILSQLRLPLIIKPRRSEGYRIIKAKNVIVREPRELEAFLEQYDQALDRFLAQEIIPGGDRRLWVCNCCFGPDSTLLGAFVFQRLGTSPPHYGVTSAALSIDNPAIVDIVARIGRGCGYVGPAMFEFKFDERDGQYKYIEVNPRLGMCNWFDTLCGIENVYFTYQLAADPTGVPTERQPQREGCYYLNLLTDFYSRIADGQSFSSIARLYSRILPHDKVWAIHTWSDPWPGLVSLAEQLHFGFRSLIRRIRRALISGA